MEAIDLEIASECQSDIVMIALCQLEMSFNALQSEMLNLIRYAL